MAENSNGRCRFAVRRPIAVSGLLAAAIGLLLSAAACAPSHPKGPAATGQVAVRKGDLEIIDPFLPEPASPSVAAVYLTVRDVGRSADELMSVSSPIAKESMLMTEDDSGSAGTMGRLPFLRIPAHGEASLRPGQDHAMLEQPRPPLRIGQTVIVDLRFARAGTVVVRVPVVPLDRILQGIDRTSPTTARPVVMGEM